MVRGVSPLKTKDTNVIRTTQRKDRTVAPAVVLDYGSVHGRPQLPEKALAVYTLEAIRQLSEDFPSLRKQE
ncbi:hypothetical protein JB92DRAFT_2785117 [Gautieria morchelliformis]|nr:hypothetical protein JB92DRAFT_2785117 [Gautieria morchelliformis]